MKRIAPDVERLMWLVADERDARAIADFESRFPELRLELAKHIAMVNGLKGAARKVPPHDIPRFVPRYAPPRPILARSTYVAFAFILAAVAFGAYSVNYWMANPPPKPVAVPLVKTESPTPPVVKVIPLPPSNVPYRPAPTFTPPDVAEIPKTEDPLDKPLTLKSQSLPLVAAIQLLCVKSGLRCDIGPGLPEVDVSLDYQDVRPADVLADLGQRYGFTAFPQERGNVLIIPVRKDGSREPVPIRAVESGQGTVQEKPTSITH